MLPFFDDSLAFFRVRVVAILISGVSPSKTNTGLQTNEREAAREVWRMGGDSE